MPQPIYENNECCIEIERVDNYESKVNVNGENLIWISNESKEEFRQKLVGLLNEYRI